MLAIRMQRTGRKGHAMFRVVVQESRLTPTSGKVVALLGSYDPHAKTAVLDKDKAATFLKNGAQPSERAASLLKSQGVTLPDWVVISDKKAGALRNPEKLRKNQPKEEAPKAEKAEDAEAPADKTTEADAEAAATPETEA